MPHGPARVALAGVAALALLACGLAPTVAAHNPAATLFHPVPVGDRLLVLGGEGTYAYLSSEGQVRERGNLSEEAEVLQAPVWADGQAATLVRSLPDLVPHVQAFDEEGPTWRVQAAPEGERGFLLAGDTGFAVFTTDGRQLSLDEQGRIQAEHELAAPAQARPAPAEAGGWWVPMADELARLEEGRIVEQAAHGNASPTDVTQTQHGVLLSLTHQEGPGASIRAYDTSLTMAWNRSLEGLRLGGSPAALDERIIVGTYDPDGARLVALDASEGTILWEREIPDATAVAPSAVDDTILAASTAGLAAYGADGDHAWRHGGQLYLESPAVVGDLVIPSSSGNRLTALHTDGTEAWSWSDGVKMPSWAHHEETDEPPDQAGEPQPEAQETPSLAGVSLAVLGLAAALAARRRIGS